MKALLCTELGSLDKLSIQDVPSPRAGANQVVIDVKASSLNFPDVLMVKGMYQIKPPLPFSPGSELAGVVKEVGDGVKNFNVGDRVVGICGYGGFAEEAVAPADRLMPLPAEMPYDLGAAFGLTYCTSLHALQECAHLKKGETLLVLGAAGGVGIAAVEIGRLMGARVIAAASTDDKLAACKQAGADDLINYSTQDLRQRLKEIAGEKGVDVVYDPVGGPYSEPALRATAWNGRFLVVGFAAGEIPKIPLNLVLLRERSIVGVYWGDWSRHDPAGNARNVKQLIQWIAEGKIKPLISERVSLRDATAAMKRLTNREVKGKVVILPEA
ncbi:MAG TPA: NADPH:quinone oxidoreductase family protein [Burkholderiales bacterium]